MHRSRLGAFVIDCNNLNETAQFWAAALGTTIAENDEHYAMLAKNLSVELEIILQKVPEAKAGKNRVHLDFITDNLEAEVERLEKLGATRQSQVEHWWIMLDPDGNEFCVVPSTHEEYFKDANNW